MGKTEHMSQEWLEARERDDSTTPPPDQVQVQRNEAAARYEGRLDGEIASVVDYRLDDATLTILHTVTEPRFRGRGLAGHVTRAVLDDARSRGQVVRPICPYTARFIDEHPTYRDLLA